MSDVVATNRRVLWASIALAILISCQVAGVIMHFDEKAFELLLQRLDSAEVTPINVATSTLPTRFVTAVNLATAGGVSAAAFFLTYKFGKTARIIVTLQLLLLTLILQAVVWSLAHLPGHPISLTTAIVCGALFGHLFKKYERRELKFEAQYHEISARNKELLEARLQLVKQDEIDRRILAADLHDQVLNDLKQVRQVIHDSKDQLGGDAHNTIDTLMSKAMTGIREVMDSLAPSDLEHLGLIGAMEEALEKCEARAGYRSRFRSSVADDELEILNMVEQTLLYRLVQESVTNICKHAKAEIVKGEVSKNGEMLVVRITDNGKGIDWDNFSQESRGLRYMRQRADLIGATIAWMPGERGVGTTVEIKLNLGARAQAATT
jgi:signal transduction histidine kinase